MMSRVEDCIGNLESFRIKDCTNLVHAPADETSERHYRASEDSGSRWDIWVNGFSSPEMSRSTRSESARRASSAINPWSCSRRSAIDVDRERVPGVSALSFG